MVTTRAHTCFTVKTPTLSVLLLGLSWGTTGCTTGNERGELGNGETYNTYKLNEFVDSGEPAPIGSDPATALTLARETWKPTTVLVPVDGLASRPVYVQHPLLASKTARQRGEQPSATSALELDGDSQWTVVGEIAASGPLALWDGVRMLAWDIWAEPVWKEKVRPPLMDYQRAAPGTQRIVRGANESPADSASWYGSRQQGQQTAPKPQSPDTAPTRSETAPAMKPLEGTEPSKTEPQPKDETFENLTTKGQPKAGA
jgi:hypothetical protein